MSAISGERFVEAGRSAIELLKRNALDAFTVWWLPGVVVSMLSLVLSLCWACVCAAIAWFSWHRRSSPGGPIFAVALVCFLLTLAIMDGLGRVLLNCLDAVFLCYAIDRDTSQVSNAEVHDVFAKNPGIFVAQVRQGEQGRPAAAMPPPPRPSRPRPRSPWRPCAPRSLAPSCTAAPSLPGTEHPSMARRSSLTLRPSPTASMRTAPRERREPAPPHSPGTAGTSRQSPPARATACPPCDGVTHRLGVEEGRTDEHASRCDPCPWLTSSCAA